MYTQTSRRRTDINDLVVRMAWGRLASFLRPKGYHMNGILPSIGPEQDGKFKVLGTISTHEGPLFEIAGEVRPQTDLTVFTMLRVCPQGCPEEGWSFAAFETIEGKLYFGRCD